MKAIVSTLLSGLITATLLAQSSPATKPSLPVANGTPIPLTAAVVVRYNNDGTIELQETGKHAQQLKLAVHPVFIDRNGKLIPPGPGAINPGAKVLVHYMPYGSETIVDRLIVQ